MPHARSLLHQIPSEMGILQVALSAQAYKQHKASRPVRWELRPRSLSISPWLLWPWSAQEGGSDSARICVVNGDIPLNSHFRIDQTAFSLINNVKKKMWASLVAQR